MTGIPSHYSINVARAHPTRKQWIGDKPAYVHYCTVEPSHTAGLPDATALLNDTRMRYPAPEFKVEMTWWQCVGHAVDNEQPQPETTTKSAADDNGGDADV